MNPISPQQILWPPLFLQPLSCIVGLSSMRSTKLCRVGISFIAHLDSTVWSEKGRFYNVLLLAQAMFFELTGIYHVYLFWELKAGPAAQHALSTGICESATETTSSAKMVLQCVIESGGSHQTAEDLRSSLAVSSPLPLSVPPHSCAWCD